MTVCGIQSAKKNSHHIMELAEAPVAAVRDAQYTLPHRVQERHSDSDHVTAHLRFLFSVSSQGARICFHI